MPAWATGVSRIPFCVWVTGEGFSVFLHSIGALTATSLGEDETLGSLSQQRSLVLDRSVAVTTSHPSFGFTTSRNNIVSTADGHIDWASVVIYRQLTEEGRIDGEVAPVAVLRPDECLRPT
jgi:hypothetical protein